MLQPRAQTLRRADVDHTGQGRSGSEHRYRFAYTDGIGQNAGESAGGRHRKGDQRKVSGQNSSAHLVRRMQLESERTERPLRTSTQVGECDEDCGEHKDWHPHSREVAGAEEQARQSAHPKDLGQVVTGVSQGDGGSETGTEAAGSDENTARRIAAAVDIAGENGKL